VGKFLTDPIWWFFLFWLPSFLNGENARKVKEFMAAFPADPNTLKANEYLIAHPNYTGNLANLPGVDFPGVISWPLAVMVVYCVSTVGSISGGWLPKQLINSGMDANKARKSAMFLIALFPLTVLLASRLVFGCALIALFAIDLEHHLLPNAITVPGIAAGLVFSLFSEPGWQASLIGALAGGGALYAIAEAYYRVRHEEGLGMGDVKMLAMIGAFLGWKLVLVTLVLASFSGTIVGVGVLIARKESLKYALPFGTFLAIGAMVSAAVGDPLVAWYFGLY